MNGKQDQKITVFHLRCSNYAGGPETTLLGWLKYADHERFTPRVVFFEERYGLHRRSLEIFADHKVPVELIPWGYTRNLPGALRALVAKVRTAPHPTSMRMMSVRTPYPSSLALLPVPQSWFPIMHGMPLASNATCLKRCAVTGCALPIRS
jgi:hypothetical protein